MTEDRRSPSPPVIAERMYDNDRADLLPLLKPARKRVLDIGCATGRLGGRLLEMGAAEVVGVEMDAASAQEAAGRLTVVVTGDVEALELPYPDGYFDHILYADVLEHLRDPWSVTRKHRRLLAPGGTAVASVPNVRQWRVLRDLLLGRWRYTDSGLMDIGHLRFMTRREIRQLFEQAGYRDVRLLPRIVPGKAVTLSRPFGGLGRDWVTLGFYVVAG